MEGYCYPEKRIIKICIRLMTMVAQTVKSLPATQETWVQSLGQEESTGEGNGNPIQYSWLENPMDRGAWWASLGVAESDTTEQLTLFSDMEIERKG